MQIISVLPIKDSYVNTTSFLITENTQVEFLAQSYRFVYCLDMSPSHTAIDTNTDEILFDQIINRFRISLLKMCEKVGIN